MRLSTLLIVIGVLLIVIPIPVLPPFVGTIGGLSLLVIGLLLRLFNL